MNQNPAVVYYRMSSDDQSVSIERQTAEVERLAERENYSVIKVFKDEGKSGAKETDKRDDFNRLLLDAGGGEFKAVLCYNASRFARLDTIDGAFAKQILRKHGVILHTVTEGKIDWNTQQGRMYDFMLSEQNAAYSRELSGNSISGRVRALNAGSWPHGAVPYGYDRLYQSGGDRHLIPRGQPFRKPRGWTLHLVANPDEAAVVRRVFDEYVNRAASLRQIAIGLNSDKVPPPDNLPRMQKRGWTWMSVKTVLGHRAYTGVAEMGRGKKSAKVVFNRVPELAREGVCPVIVDRETWEAAQQIQKQRLESRSRPHSRDAAALSGFLFCGHCGYTLLKEKQPTNGAMKYVCKMGAVNYGPDTCPQWRVDEEYILPLVVERVISGIDAELLRLLDDTPKEGQELNKVAILTKHVEALKKKVATASRRFLTIEDDAMASAVEADVKQLQTELKESEDALTLAKAVENEGGVVSFHQWWTEQKENVLFAVMGRRTWEGGMIVCTEFAGTAVSPEPELVVTDEGEVYEVDHNPDFGPPDAGSELARPLAFDKDGFRALLSRLGLSVTLYWRKAESRKGNKKYEVDKTRIKISLKWHGSHGNRGKRSTDGSNHEVATSAGTCCRKASGIGRGRTRANGSVAAGNGRSSKPTTGGGYHWREVCLVGRVESSRSAVFSGEDGGPRRLDPPYDSRTDYGQPNSRQRNEAATNPTTISTNTATIGPKKQR